MKLGSIESVNPLEFFFKFQGRRAANGMAIPLFR